MVCLIFMTRAWNWIIDYMRGGGGVYKNRIRANKPIKPVDIVLKLPINKDQKP